MNYQAIDLGNSISREKEVLPNSEELLGSLTSKDEHLDLIVLKAVIKRQEENAGDTGGNIETMLEIVDSAITNLKEVNSTWTGLQALAEEQTGIAPIQTMRTFSVGSNFKSVVSGAKTLVSKGISAIKSFADAINPSKNLKGILAMIEFAACSIPNLLNSLISSAKSLVGNVGSFKDSLSRDVANFKGSLKDLPSRLKTSLANSLIDITQDILNKKLNDSALVGNFIANVKPILDANPNALNDIIALFGSKTKSLGRPSSVETLLRDTLRANGYISFDGFKDANIPVSNSNMYLPYRNPPTKKLTCSELARRINLLDDSILVGTKYSNSKRTARDLNGIEDLATRNFIDSLLGANDQIDMAQRELEIHNSTGYSDANFLDATISMLLKNKELLDIVLDDLNGVKEEDELDLEIAMINILNITAYIIPVNIYFHGKLLQTKESLEMLLTTSEFYKQNTLTK